MRRTGPRRRHETADGATSEARAVARRRLRATRDRAKTPRARGDASSRRARARPMSRPTRRPKFGSFRLNARATATGPGRARATPSRVTRPSGRADWAGCGASLGEASSEACSPRGRRWPRRPGARRVPRRERASIPMPRPTGRLSSPTTRSRPRPGPRPIPRRSPRRRPSRTARAAASPCALLRQRLARPRRPPTRTGTPRRRGASAAIFIPPRARRASRRKRRRERRSRATPRVSKPRSSASGWMPR